MNATIVAIENNKRGKNSYSNLLKRDHSTIKVDSQTSMCRN